MAVHQLVLTTDTENGLRIDAAFLHAGCTKNDGESSLDFIHRCTCEYMRRLVQVAEAATAADGVPLDEDVVN